MFETDKKKTLGLPLQRARTSTSTESVGAVDISNLYRVQVGTFKMVIFCFFFQTISFISQNFFFFQNGGEN